MEKLEYKPSIVVISNDVEYTELIKKYIENQGFVIDVVATIQQADHLVDSKRIDLLIICATVMNLNCNIFNILIAKSKIQYIVLTDLSNICETDIIYYLHAGAADVVDRSTRSQLLVAKIRILLNIRSCPSNKDRNMNTQAYEFHQIGQLEININAGSVIYQERKVDLTNNEFSLLLLFIQKPNSIFSREALYQSLLKCEYDGISRSIDNTVFRIRKKLESEGITDISIKSVRGKGYCYYT